jgi:hypothetical protein
MCSNVSKQRVKHMEKGRVKDLLISLPFPEDGEEEGPLYPDEIQTTELPTYMSSGSAIVGRQSVIELVMEMRMCSPPMAPVFCQKPEQPEPMERS